MSNDQDVFQKLWRVAAFGIPKVALSIRGKARFERSGHLAQECE
jgi:hypothetical protein